MDAEKVFGRAVIVLPVAHVLVCTVFLAGYSVGFGGHIATLFSPKDFFSVTLEHLILIYTTGLVMPAAILVSRHRAGFTYEADRIAKIEDADTRVQELSKLLSYRKLLNWLFVSVIITSTSILILTYVYNCLVPWYFCLSAMMVAISPIWWKTAHFFNLHGLRGEIIYIVIVFVVAVFSLGLDNGQLDRRAGYDTFLANHYRCGKTIVIGAVGDRFVAVLPNAQRAIIDQECKARFVFARAVPISDQPLGYHITRSLKAWVGRNFVAPTPIG